MELISIRDLYRNQEKVCRTDGYGRRMVKKRQRFQNIWILSGS